MACEDQTHLKYEIKNTTNIKSIGINLKLSKFHHDHEWKQASGGQQHSQGRVTSGIRHHYHRNIRIQQIL